VEKEIKRLFDLQKFVQDEELEKYLKSPKMLSEDELDMISAAGESTGRIDPEKYRDQ